MSVQCPTPGAFAQHFRLALLIYAFQRPSPPLDASWFNCPANTFRGKDADNTRGIWGIQGMKVEQLKEEGFPVGLWLVVQNHGGYPV